MVEPGQLSERLAQVQDVVRSSGRDVRILAATKYLQAQDLPALAQAGITLVGENRAQSLVEKHGLHAELFEWHFIGQLQSRKVKQIVPLVTMIHSLASESALSELLKHQRPGLEVLVEVNIAGEQSKAGIAPQELPRYLESLPIAGLMTMPPQDGEARRWFSALRELAHKHGLEQLSMGTSGDYADAIAEGATIVRLGSGLYR